MSITVKITVNNARTGKHEDVATLHIVNDGTGTPGRGNYTFTLRSKGREIRGGLQNFRRDQPDGALRLVAKVLEVVAPFKPELRYSDDVCVAEQYLGHPEINPRMLPHR